MREFESGATRDDDSDKYDYEGFLSPSVIKRYAEYMHKHRFQADGKLRASDNWIRGIPKDAYIKSAFRHFVDWWAGHRRGDKQVEESLCALIFNIQGYLHELLKEAREQDMLKGILRTNPPSGFMGVGIPFGKGDPPVCLCHSTWNKCPAHD